MYPIANVSEKVHRAGGWSRVCLCECVGGGRTAARALKREQGTRVPSYMYMAGFSIIQSRQSHRFQSLLLMKVFDYCIHVCAYFRAWVNKDKKINSIFAYMPC